MYRTIDGKSIAGELRSKLKIKVEEYRSNSGKEIGLAVVLVGDNAASQVYVRNKIKACEDVGIKSYAYYLPAQTAQSDIEELICTLANDDNIHGILVQLPLPQHINAEKVLSLIPKSKDVDGFSAANIGELCLNGCGLISCTPYGVMKMLEHENISVRGKNAVVIGRSNIVGKPMAMLLLNADATVTMCHSKTVNLKEHCLNADILVSAIGKAKFVTSDMVKEGAVVIDVGINRDENNKLCGDVDFENVKDKCSYITPVPGGVGPMTITTLLYNTYKAATGAEID